MIRTLRIKFVMINMILVFLVLAAVFGALCVTSYRQVVRDNEMTLRMAASRAKEVEPPKMEVGKKSRRRPLSARRYSSCSSTRAAISCMSAPKTCT